MTVVVIRLIVANAWQWRMAARTLAMLKLAREIEILMGGRPLFDQFALIGVEYCQSSHARDLDYLLAPSFVIGPLGQPPQQACRHSLNTESGVSVPFGSRSCTASQTVPLNSGWIDLGWSLNQW